jgi:cation diffusion facilitator CzcD-associated flavoprotein CzcO
MLDNLILRSPLDWHIDPTDQYTIQDFLRQERAGNSLTSSSLNKDTFLDYVDWFIRRHGIVTQPIMVQRLTRQRERLFSLECEDGKLWARNVVIATGLRQFRHIPTEFKELCETGHGSHSSDHINYQALRGKTVLIVGGRQSAYEAVREISSLPGAQVYVSHRHPLPAFAKSNWAWIGGAVEELRKDPNWFAAMPRKDQESIELRFWSEGREKLEPWLAESVDRPNVEIHAMTHITAARMIADRIEVELSDGARLRVDHILFATGYHVDVAKLQMLADVQSELVTIDGFPQLDSSMQSSIPGLYFTGLFCTKRFGPIFGFVLGCQVAPQILIDGLCASIR